SIVSVRGWWCWVHLHARPPAYFSIQRAGIIRTGWQTEAEWWGATCTTRPARTGWGFSPGCWTGSVTMRTESVGRTSIHPGGWTTRNWTSPEGIIWSTGVGWACRLTDSVSEWIRYAGTLWTSWATPLPTGDMEPG